MLALQGPASLGLLAPLCEGIDPLEAAAFTFAEARVAGVPCTVARTGYTGEPGVELICPATELVALWDALIEAGAVPCGLGARDALRLEVCYPLHGNDITQDTNAIEAGLGWVCAAGKQYVGSDVARPHARRGPAAPARGAAHGRGARRAAARVPDPRTAGDVVGEVTSGTFSPTLERGIGLGYVPSALADPDTAIAVDVRGRTLPAHTARKPLYVRRSDEMPAAESYPDDLRYHREHDWAARGRRHRHVRRHLVRAGLARRPRRLPAARGGRRGDGRGASTASWSRSRPCPASSRRCSGTVTEVNQAVIDAPELVNDDPYGQGWLIRVQLSNPAELDELLDATAYAALVTGL